MAGTRALERLLRVLTVEEEQALAALETEQAHLRFLQNRLHSAVERERAGWCLVIESAMGGDALDRLAGMHEKAYAKRLADLLQPLIAKTGEEAARRREAFLAKRVERRQAETLICEAKAGEAAESTRRAQQTMDDWFLGRMQRNQADNGAGSKDAPVDAGGEFPNRPGHS